MLQVAAVQVTLIANIVSIFRMTFS